MLNCSFNNKNTAAVLITAGTVLLISLTIWLNIDAFDKIQSKNNTPAANTIVVSATSEVYAKPDLALTTFSVLSEAKTVGEAMQENTIKMNAVIASVKSQGVEDKDLKTTNFNISPRYDYNNNAACPLYSSFCPPGTRILVGYDISQSLEVKMRDLTKIGSIIESAAQAGANEVGGLQFTVDNEDALKDEARNRAIDEAKAKAKVLAGQLGIKLVKIVNFSESGQFPIFYAPRGEAVGMGGATPDIQTGENKISVTVTLTYQVK